MIVGFYDDRHHRVIIDRRSLAVSCPSLFTRKMYFIKKKMKEYTFVVESDEQGTAKGSLSIITRYHH
jgi:hypothetical protein